MTPKTREAMTSSNNDHWQTPDVVLDALSKFAWATTGLPGIALDPCASRDPDFHTAVTEWSTDRGDGDSLLRPWREAAGGGLIYVNPPYSQVKAWMKKCVEEALDGAVVIALVAARTETSWFHDYIWNEAHAIGFFRGRLTFVGAPSPALFPSAVVLWMPSNVADRVVNANFAAAFGASEGSSAPWKPRRVHVVRGQQP